jgi:hypothetical protein
LITKIISSLFNFLAYKYSMFVTVTTVLIRGLSGFGHSLNEVRKMVGAEVIPDLLYAS